MRSMILAVVGLSLLSGVANAQDGKAPRGWTKGIAQADCTADKGLRWQEADEFVSAKTGTVRKQAAGCKVDSKAAAFILYKMNAKR